MFLTDKNIIVVNELDSTNNYAKQLLAQKVAEGTVVLAHYQKKGRGQVGNLWESEEGKNLLFSLILYPGFLDAAKQFFISKIVSLALIEVLKKYLGGVTIKWPNDIYVGEQKIAGILIENTMKGNYLESSVIGVGLNVNQQKFRSEAPNPVSMRQLLDQDSEIDVILTSFLHQLEHCIALLIQEKFDDIDKVYFNNLFRGVGWHCFRRNGEEFKARISGIGSFGQLQLEEPNGDRSEFMFKEVEFVI